MDGPRDKVEGSVVDYLVLPLPFPLSVPLPSVRGESGGLASGGVSLPFRLPLPLPLPFPFKLSPKALELKWLRCHVKTT